MRLFRRRGGAPVDVLVNNAGSASPAFIEEGGTELRSLPYMRKQKSGTVVMLGSRSAWRTEIKGMGLYGSSKAAVHAIGETMAVELEPFGIRVLIVEPGAFRT
ncbi:hypothetical protein JVU11DRAFT_8508 [Chiua virens]|nr:hypothetical protein JVU11DRAFT_8508 [Chiua virens]